MSPSHNLSSRRFVCHAVDRASSIGFSMPRNVLRPLWETRIHFSRRKTTRRRRKRCDDGDEEEEIEKDKLSLSSYFNLLKDVDIWRQWCNSWRYINGFRLNSECHDILKPHNDSCNSVASVLLFLGVLIKKVSVRLSDTFMRSARGKEWERSSHDEGGGEPPSHFKNNWCFLTAICNNYKKGCESGFPYCFFTDFTKLLLRGSTLLDVGFLTQEASWIHRILKIWCHDQKNLKFV